MPIFLTLLLLLLQNSLLIAENEVIQSHDVEPGDTWAALSIRFGIPISELMGRAGAINPQLQPVIGSTVSLREAKSLNGRLLRPFAGGVIETAVTFDRSPWATALQNDLSHPYLPLLYRPIVLPIGDDPLRELPGGIESLLISDIVAQPGQALALRAKLEAEENLDMQISLDNQEWITLQNGDHLLALGATGAFFNAGTAELRIQAEQYPLWVQPWLFKNKDWNYDQVSFVETAANERETIIVERERLQKIWAQVTPEPLWDSTFIWPLQDFVELTSHYGARRSVNGGPYDTYHEGTDFSAYRGSPVYAPAGGKVVLAEPLIVRGGTVILDHGLGIHTGYYHLSKIKIQQGAEVEAGDLLGEVGTTGRSTGNHLHWDLLIGTSWVDAEAWIGRNLANWIRDGWGESYPYQDLHDMPPKA